MFRILALASLTVGLVLADAAQAEVKVVVKGVHLCCGACAKAVGKALGGIAGVKPACDTKAKTVTITAKDEEAAQKALNALAAAGFHGTTDNDKLAIKDDSGAKKGKVKRITVSGVHNCCGACCKALKAAV